MNIKIITVPFDAENEGFRDDVLTKFLINKKVRSLQPQHLCRLCGHILANERFSGKGHKDHTCKKWVASLSDLTVALCVSKKLNKIDFIEYF